MAYGLNEILSRVASYFVRFKVLQPELKQNGSSDVVRWARVDNDLA